ncbi:MAG: amidase [Alphaproteobacteria bacterium]|jgi:aspartyl-tRNA(Asn)/glutamyl-tRNA(Gln) amidotransferase subunit A
MTNPTQMSLVDAADAVAAKKISARELTEACIARAEDAQPTLNCFISLDPEGALAEADSADAAQAQGADLGPLHGVPLAHKDMYYRTGKISTCGSKIRRDFVAQTTSTALTRLADAGALHLGGLNMSEFAVGPFGHNDHWGHCRNPWNPDHVTGGSSSGAGSAVGGRTVFGALGSDTGGSVRLPAACCGLVGMKPTQTRVSRYGIMGLSFSLDNVGPLTRTVRDNARMLQQIAGADPKDPTTASTPVGDYEGATQNPDIKGLRIAVPRNYYYDDATPEIRALMTASLKVFESLGAEIIEVDVTDHEEINTLATVLRGPEAATLHGAWLRDRPEDYGPQIRARLEPGLAMAATHYVKALQMRPQISKRFIDAIFKNADVFHVPTIAMPVPSIAETDVQDGPDFPALVESMTHCTRPFNYLGLPALAVPAGHSENGLPASFQLVGRPFQEARLYRAAAAYESETKFYATAPALT